MRQNIDLRECSAVAALRDGLELFKLGDFFRLTAHLLQLVNHVLEVGVLGCATDLLLALRNLNVKLFAILVSFDISAESLAEITEAFDVSLDDVEILDALIFIEDRDIVLPFVPVGLLAAHFMIDEVDLVAVLTPLDCDFLPNALDRHQNDAVLARLLEQLLRLLFVSPHKVRLLGVDDSQNSLLLGYLIGVV